MIRSVSFRAASILLLALAAAPVVGCGSKLPEPVEPAPAPPPSNIPPPASDAPPMASGPGDKVQAMDQPKDIPAPTPAPSALTDEAIFHVLHTASAGEIDQAKLAQKKSKDANVKKLADMMNKDHTDADKKGAALAKQVKLTPAENEVSALLASDAKKSLEALGKETGPAFDKAYVDGQVKDHTAVLETIDKKLLPAARNEELKTFLGKLRTRIAEHLDMAKKTQAELGAKK